MYAFLALQVLNALRKHEFNQLFCLASGLGYFAFSDVQLSLSALLLQVVTGLISSIMSTIIS